MGKVATIKISSDARDRLRALKRGGESYDAVIWRLITNTVITLEDAEKYNVEIVRRKLETAGITTWSIGERFRRDRLPDVEVCHSSSHFMIRPMRSGFLPTSPLYVPTWQMDETKRRKVNEIAELMGASWSQKDKEWVGRWADDREKKVAEAED